MQLTKYCWLPPQLDQIPLHLSSTDGLRMDRGDMRRISFINPDNVSHTRETRNGMCRQALQQLSSKEVQHYSELSHFTSRSPASRRGGGMGRISGSELGIENCMIDQSISGDQSSFPCRRHWGLIPRWSYVCLAAVRYSHLLFIHITSPSSTTRFIVLLPRYPLSAVLVHLVIWRWMGSDHWAQLLLLLFLFSAVVPLSEPSRSSASSSSSSYNIRRRRRWPIQIIISRIILAVIFHRTLLLFLN